MSELKVSFSSIEIGRQVGKLRGSSWVETEEVWYGMKWESVSCAQGILIHI